MRDRHFIWTRVEADLRALGLRHRRGHDLRRTFVSLAREDGAAPDVLRLATHAPSRDILDAYTSVSWERLCEEFSRLRVERPKPAKILRLHARSCCTPLIQSSETASEFAGMTSGGAGNRTLRKAGRKRTQTDPKGRIRTRIRTLDREDAPVCDRDTTRCNRFDVPSVPSAIAVRAW